VRAIAVRSYSLHSTLQGLRGFWTCRRQTLPCDYFSFARDSGAIRATTLNVMRSFLRKADDSSRGVKRTIAVADPQGSRQTHSIRKARIGSMDAARHAGKIAAADVTAAMPAKARNIVSGSLALKP
jgi:hypothetical protein